MDPGGFFAVIGCVIAVDTPEENIRAAIEAVRNKIIIVLTHE